MEKIGSDILSERRAVKLHERNRLGRRIGCGILNRMGMGFKIARDEDDLENIDSYWNAVSNGTNQPPSPKPQDSEQQTAELLRRNVRPRHRPLEYWKNERATYTYTENGSPIVKIIRPESPLKKKRERKNSNGPGAVSGAIYNPTLKQEDEQQIMVNYEQVDFRKISGFKIGNGFEPDEFCSFGLLVLPKLVVKSNKNSGKYNLRFYVLKGLVKATVHGTTFVASAGCEFLVPHGNRYEIANLHLSETRLYYSQIMAMEYQTN